MTLLSFAVFLAMSSLHNLRAEGKAGIQNLKVLKSLDSLFRGNDKISPAG
jgi:hypothetical protein